MSSHVIVDSQDMISNSFYSELSKQLKEEEQPLKVATASTKEELKVKKVASKQKSRSNLMQTMTLMHGLCQQANQLEEMKKYKVAYALDGVLKDMMAELSGTIDGTLKKSAGVIEAGIANPVLEFGRRLVDDIYNDQKEHTFIKSMLGKYKSRELALNAFENISNVAVLVDSLKADPRYTKFLNNVPTDFMANVAKEIKKKETMIMDVAYGMPGVGQKYFPRSAEVDTEEKIKTALAGSICDLFGNGFMKQANDLSKVVVETFGEW